MNFAQVWGDPLSSASQETRITDMGHYTQLHYTFFFFLFVGLEFEFKILHLQSNGPHLQSILLWLYLEMDPHELFAQTGLEQQSSPSQPPKKQGLQVDVLTVTFTGPTR
jgi:hypothetical protein